MRRASLGLGLALGLALVAPFASALDVLPSEVRLEETEARILVRSREGEVRVETTPPTLAAASSPAGEPGGFEPTPRKLAAGHTWRGLDGVVVVVLQREDTKAAVELVIEDGSQTGVWLEWPAAQRGVPGPAAWVAALGLIAAAKGFALRRRAAA